MNLPTHCEHEITRPIVGTGGSREKVEHGAPGTWYEISKEGGNLTGRVCLCDEHKLKMERQGYHLVRVS